MIATATQPQSLDAALRRPGRLSHDVCLGPPPSQARRDILHNLLKGFVMHSTLLDHFILKL